MKNKSSDNLKLLIQTKKHCHGMEKQILWLSKISCEVEYTIQLNYHQYEADQKKIDFTLKLQNEKSYDKKCEIQINSEYQNYLSSIQEQILLQIERDYENSIAQRISILCLGFVSIFNSFIAFENIRLPYTGDYFEYVILLAFFFFCLIFSINVSLFWVISRKRVQSQNLSLIKFFIKYVLIYCISFYNLFDLLQKYKQQNSFLLMIGFFMTPQIIHNIRLGTNPKFIPEYIFGLLSINIAAPVYFKGFTFNFGTSKLQLEFCICWVLIYLVQIFILYIQYKKGPRKIIPRCLLPKQYNYYQDYRPQQLEEACTICLLHLMIEPDQQEQDLDRLQFSRKLMITPCGHIFHPSCLQSRMEIKLFCPTCGNAIPPFYE
ncbi:unnamed protein product [Paramecium primaurelia]|uniref:RING-type E3 ubiquitin transferase n=1 Tax=Paramecium primaurelia TaxID=5886 RepID=A0A8S1PPR0_PARPR|nr:unnamed protein product [Paramecium primaurelia]